MEKSVWVICHSDLDGVCSGAVVRSRYPNCNVMITNYGRNRSLFKIKPYDMVFVTDFSLTLDEFYRLRQKNCEIIWIDHHKDNYETLQHQGWDCPGLRRDDWCGAALTWIFLNPDVPTEAMPDCIKLVNDYDLWKFEDPRTKDFSYGSGLYDIRPGNLSGDEFWKALFAGDQDRMNLVLKFGAHVRKYVELAQDTYCNDCAYYTQLPTPEGPKNILALTVRAGNSSVFDRMDKKNVDAVFTGQYVSNIGCYRCSMYSPDNIKEILPIVKMMGGGGHPKAAGFEANSYPMPAPELKAPVDMEKAIEGYKKLHEMRDGSVVLKQWINRSSGITLKAQYFHADMCGFPVVAVNHQFLPDLLQVASTASDCIDPKTSLPAKAYFGFVMTNTGWFRCCLYPSDTATTLQELEDAVKRTYMDAASTITKSYGGVWWYTRDLPVHPPIRPRERPQQARM